MAKPPGITPEERALWARVIATVKPIVKPKPVPPRPVPVVAEPAGVVATKPTAARPKPNPAVKAEGLNKAPPKPAAATLDASWDRRLSRGLVGPESTIDLHGHTLASAHALLDQGLDAAIRRGDRILLLITGKPPRPESERPHARGAIRAAVGDWLAASRHADRIAAVRNAHPRHGGQGALYIVLRRDRSVSSRKS